jgi:glutamyl endopeptidase
MPRKLLVPNSRWEDTDPGATSADRPDGYEGAGTVTVDQVEDGAPALDALTRIPIFAPTEAEEVPGGDQPQSSEGAPRHEALAASGGLTGEHEEVPGYRERAAALTEALYDGADESAPRLDAWFAVHPEHALATAVAAAAAPNLVEVVIGADDRTQITATTQVPWRWVCSLLITAGDGTRWIGTGWLVAPRTVITAGHCVFMSTHGGWVRSIDVIPGRNGATEPFGRCRGASFRSVTGWTQQGHRNYDYGAIILPRDCGFGRLGAFGFAALSDSALKSLRLNLSGYPGDKPAGTQWFHARTTQAVTARTIEYDIDTAGGQSGAPVWRFQDGARHAVGIHTNGALSGNSATRIVPPVFNNLNAWKAEGA